MDINFEFGGDNTGNGLVIALALKDLAGGTGSICLYREESGSFVPIETSRQNYPPADPSEVDETDPDNKIWNISLSDDDLGGINSDEPGRRYREKVVVTCTYEDGTEETVESETFDQCAGSYASLTTPFDLDTGNPYTVDTATNTVSFEFTVDPSLVDMAHLTVKPFLYRGFEELDFSSSPSEYDASDGTKRLVFTTPPLEPGTYSAGLDMVYHNNPGPHWGDGDVFDFTLS